MGAAIFTPYDKLFRKTCDLWKKQNEEHSQTEFRNHVTKLHALLDSLNNKPLNDDVVKLRRY